MIWDGFVGLQRTDFELIKSFEGAAPADIFGLGFGFSALVITLMQLMLLSIFVFTFKTFNFKVVLYMATLLWAFSLIVSYQDYSRELMLWNSRFS